MTANPPMLRRAAAVLLLAFVLMPIACDKGGAEARGGAAEEVAPFGPEKQRELAAQLRADGLDDEALAIYESLIATGRGLSDKALVGSSMIVAEIHLKKGRYEKALAALYRARLTGAEGETARKIDEMRITCFEKLGRGAAADRLLDRSTALTKPAAPVEATDVLAEIGDEKVTRQDLEAVLATAQPEVRAHAEEKEGRLQLLQGLVARRVMVRKAKKLGLDKDPEVRVACDEAEREILVRKLVADELKTEAAPVEADARLWYQAHPERFREPGSLELSVILCADADEETKVREALAAGRSFETVARESSRDETSAAKGGRIDEPAVEGQPHPFFKTTGELFSAVGDTPAGQVAPRALPVTGGRYVLLVRERREGRLPEFSEVKDKAQRYLSAARQKARIDGMLHEALQSADVKMHEDRL